MELIFLGTGAAEGVPAAYCRCATCQGVRQRGGVEIKTRSSLRVGAHHQIDVSPDHYGQMLRAGTDMYDVEHVLFTHTHGDHFALSALYDKEMSPTNNGKPISVYMSKPATAYLDRLMAARPLPEPDLRWVRANIEIHGMEYFQEYSIGGLSVQTLKGNHTANGQGEYSINYLAGLPNGRSFLYACDTGFYREETWKYLTGKHVDALILECTFAGQAGRERYPEGHLDLASFLLMLERMAGTGFIDARTSVYATHFNPHQGLGHDEIHARLQQSPYRAAAAYDGLRVQI